MRKVITAKADLLDSIVDTLYNLLFGYLDSLFDDDQYEKEEKTVPKSKVKFTEDVVDSDSNEINAEDVEVTGEAKVIMFLPESATNSEDESPSDSNLDEFEILVAPASCAGDPGFIVVVTNRTTGKSSQPKFVTEQDKDTLKQVIDKGKQDVSSTVRVALTKVSGSSKPHIKLRNICSSYDLPTTYNDLMCVLSDESVVESLPEGDSEYRIDSYEDGYELNQLDDCKFDNSVYSTTLRDNITASSYISELSWFAKGADYANFNDACRSLLYALDYQRFELAKLCIIHKVKPEFAVTSSDADCVLDKWQALKDAAKSYICSLELLSMVASDDEKSMLNAWIRELKDITLYQLESLHPSASN